MRALSWLFSLALLAGCGASHESHGDGGMTDDGGHATDGSIPVDGASSWIVTASMTIDTNGGPTPGDVPSAHRFTLNLVPSTEGATGIAGTFGDAQPIAFSGGAALTLTDPVALAIDDDTRCHAFGPVTYQQLSLNLVDDNGDGRADRLQGTGSGAFMISEGDVVWEATFTATVAGVPDDEAPTLTLLGTTDAGNPVDPITLRASEPLAPETTITLEAESGESVTLAPVDGRAATFTTPDSGWLSWGTTYRVVVSPSLTDYAGNTASADLSFTTADDPGVQPEDGFEGGAVARVFGGAALVDAADGAQVIEGSSSMILPPNSVSEGRAGVTMRLAVEPGDTVLHLRYRLLGNGMGGAWFIGSATLHTRSNPATALSIDSGATGDWVESGIANAPYMGAEGTLDAPLPDGVTDEVLLDIRLQSVICGGPLPALAGMMFDDVRID